MSTYLKYMGGYTYKQLKGKNFDEIQKLFDKEMKRVNTFVAMGSKVQESKAKKVEGSEQTAKGNRKKMLRRKRARKEQQQESSKKQRIKEDKESNEVNEVSEDDKGELMKHLVIKKDEDIAIDSIPLATKLPVIIDYKLHKEGMLVHYQLIRADGSSKRYSSMIRMLQGIDREDLEGDLKVMFERDIRSDVWRILQGYRVTVWKLIDSSGVHFVRRNLKIQKMNIKFRGELLGLKRLHGFLEVTTAQVHNGNYAKWFGISKWYQSFALRNFDLEDMKLESTNSGPTAKLPILKLVPQTSQENGVTVTKMSTPATAEEKTNKKNDVKVRGLLLMTLLNEYQLTFSQYPDAKSMFAAIKTRFGGNAATKKTQKTLLKQQYKNFNATSAESFNSIFNRL
ncbi:hypothetical protein Tco_0389462 [Tanacetum coccineum]